MRKEKNKPVVMGKVSFNIVGPKYYIVNDSTGAPAADFLHTAGGGRGGVIVPRDEDSSGDIKV